MGACTSKETRQVVENNNSPSGHPIPPVSQQQLQEEVPISRDIQNNKLSDENLTNAGTPSTLATPGQRHRAEKAQMHSDEDEEEDDDLWDNEDDQLAGAQVDDERHTKSRRRRLSVSTIDAAQPREEMRSGDLSPELYDADGKKQSKRTQLVKFDDPALQLVDRSRGQVREVTLKMLKELFPGADHYAVFGSPSSHTQRGFDNKIQEIDGSMGEGRTLQDKGIGFACKKGLKPESPNQDDFFVLKIDDWMIYGVFDGHGPYGHEISGFVHKTLPFLLISDPQFEKDILGTLKRAFWRAHHLIEAAAEQNNASLDCSLSGTTATVVVHNVRDKKLYVAHVGDSRSVIGQKIDGKYTAMNLTQDHKPTNPKELARIEAAGGEVRRLDGDIPHRVFVGGRMYPGLAMSRAIGDTVGAAVGVTPDPDVRVHNITSQDKFLIISTDGVWEFISSQAAVDIVSKKKRHQSQAAADALAYESWTRWVEEEENVVDDVTCVVVWLTDEEPSPRTARVKQKKSKKSNTGAGSSPSSPP